LVEALAIESRCTAGRELGSHFDSIKDKRDRVTVVKSVRAGRIRGDIEANQGDGAAVDLVVEILDEFGRVLITRVW
jgi:hypothetical protein